jgi:hypothetical protein
MKHLFYFFTIFALFWEFSIIADVKKYSQFKTSFKKLIKENIKIDDWTTLQKTFSFLQLGYVLWTFVGIFTFQWPVFILFILISMIPKPYKWMMWLDAFISILILLFVLINAYHLKIDVFGMIKSLF